MSLKFVKNILDDVHGLIPITSIEKEIIDTRIFKRLQDIKQLSLTHWIFPGSEHTRYSHSLGVMHIIDKMALSLNFSDEDRQIVRLAGLLHDIGHYPLSHVGEAAYSKNIQSYGQEKEFFNGIIAAQYKEIEQKIVKIKNQVITKDFLTLQTNKFHHEKVSSKIATENKEILEIFEKYLKMPDFEIKQNIDNLKQQLHHMITGYVDMDMDDSLCVKIQLLHSELDADRLDYLLRDSKSSGTSYGTIDIDFLISNLKIGSYEGKSIVGIDKKAINAADQFMISRFFAYTNVIFNDKVSFLGEIAELLMRSFAKENDCGLITKDVFENEIIDNKDLKDNKITDSFYKFNDVSFWNLIYYKDQDYFPEFLKNIKSILLQKKSIKCIDKTELRIITNSVKEFVDACESTIQKINKENYPIFIVYNLTKHVPKEKFESLFNKDVKLKNEKMIRRLYDGLAVIDDKECHLLIDDRQSLIHNCWNLTLYCLREYDIKQNS